MRKHTGQESGFTLIELLVVMAISMFVLVAASKVMISMTTQFKQQTRISEKSIEGGVGMEMIRRDISLAGFGLATGTYSGINEFANTDWSFMNSTYKELDAGEKPGSFFQNPNKPPKMIEAHLLTDLAIIDTHGLNGSSYLTVRSPAVGSDPVAGRFVLSKKYVEGKFANTSSWDSGLLDPNQPDPDPDRDPKLTTSDLVVVVSTADKDNLGLVTDLANPTKFYANMDNNGRFGNFDPVEVGDIHVAYGVSNTGTALSAPFNRVDYYVGRTGVPEKCAPETGVLYRAQMLHARKEKAALMQGSPQLSPPEPPVRVMDCVAMMHVEFGIGNITTSFLDTYTAADIRKKLNRVDVFILTHEGQFDPGYEYYDKDNTGEIILNPLSDNPDPAVFPAATKVKEHLVNGVPYWKHFRWRVYKLSGRPVGKGTF